MANYHKHWYGTLALYTAIATKDSNTLYHCSEGLIYRGSVLLATRRWGDLSGVPSTFAPSAHNHTKSQITDFPTTWAWASLTGVPSTFTPSAHTHDDRYYTESEINTKLTNGSVTKLGTSTVGSSNKPIYLNGGTPTAVSSVGEAFLSWGGRNWTGAYAPIDAAMVPTLGANRLAFLAASSIDVEYSRDNGSTWLDYEASDVQKISLVSGLNSSLVIGKADSTNKATSAYKLRVTINTAGRLYTVLNKFILYISTNGSQGSTCSILGRTQDNKILGADSWTVFADKVPIGGWSGYNVINTSAITTYGNTPASHFGQVRFLFENTGGSTSYNGLNIIRILGYGGVGWQTPSNLAGNGTLYSYDAYQNAHFPQQVNAQSFLENGTYLSDKYASKAQTMYIGTTAVNINRTSGALALTGITSIDPIQISGGMKNGLSPFTDPHLALKSSNQIDTTGYVGMTFATSAAVNYGFSLGALRASGGNGHLIVRSHLSNAAGTEVFKLDMSGNLSGLNSVSATSFSGSLTGNASSATVLATARTINGVSFNGSANITITANTPYTLTRGSYLTGSNFNGSANTTWAVDATSANTASKVVARDSNGDFACRVVNAASGVYSLKVVTGGYNYTTQTNGVGIGTDGANSGVIFYNGTGATGRIYRESDVMRFIRGGLSYSGFDINADGSVTVQGDMTTRTSLVVGSANGTYVQIGSARLVYDQTNNAIKVVNADNSSCSLYATGSISAFGIGSSGGSGTSYSRLDDWADYVDGLTNDYVLSAELGHGLYTSVNALNSFQSGTSWGGTYTGIVYLSIGGTSKSVSTPGHTHHFSTISNKPTTLGGYGITDAMPSSGGTIYSSNFQMLELKRNAVAGASILFSNNNQALGKFGFDSSGSLIIGNGTSTDGVPNMLYINTSTKQITGYGSLNVSGNIETGTSGGAYVRIGHSRFMYDSADSGIILLKVAGGFANFYAGSVYANNVQLTSSRSMKKDIQPFKNGLDLIKSIDVVSYLYKQDADDDDRKIGFIADDTDSWLSGKSKTKYNIGNTVGALIKAVQELEKKNQELEKILLSTTNNKLRI